MEIHNLVPIPTKTWHFKVIGESNIIHIIKTGFQNNYIVLWEYGHNINGSCEIKFMTKEQIEGFYKIEIK